MWVVSDLGAVNARLRQVVAGKDELIAGQDELIAVQGRQITSQAQHIVTQAEIIELLERKTERSSRVRSYLVSARGHGHRAIDAIHTALTGNPWLPTPITA